MAVHSLFQMSHGLIYSQITDKFLSGMSKESATTLLCAGMELFWLEWNSGVGADIRIGNHTDSYIY